MSKVRQSMWFVVTTNKLSIDFIHSGLVSLLSVPNMPDTERTLAQKMYRNIANLERFNNDLENAMAKYDDEKEKPNQPPDGSAE